MVKSRSIILPCAFMFFLLAACSKEKEHKGTRKNDAPAFYHDSYFTVILNFSLNILLAPRAYSTLISRIYSPAAA